jgi:hypothetical protein
MKFKIGDPVRIIARTCRYFDQVGTVADIVPEADHSFRVAIPGEHPLWFGPHELVLAEQQPTNERPQP